MSSIIYDQGTATFNVPAGGSVAVFTRDSAVVLTVGNYPNVPPSLNQIGVVLAGVVTTFGPFTNATVVQVQGGAGETYYSVGTAPAITDRQDYSIQPTPVAVNVTGAVSSAAILGGIVTSTTAAAVAGTIPTGAVLDAATTLAVGESFSWSVINTGPNTFTVTAAANHTIVGTATVATATSGYFRTVKTAAGTFITYRLS